MTPNCPLSRVWSFFDGNAYLLSSRFKNSGTMILCDLAIDSPVVVSLEHVISPVESYVCTALSYVHSYSHSFHTLATCNIYC